MAESEPTASLYDRIGGEATLSLLVDSLYERVTNDEELRPFFVHSSVETIRRMQREFLAAALDGPIVYAGRGLREAHAGRGINKGHFRKFIDHLMGSLQEYDISEQDSYDIISRLNTHVDAVTGDATVDG